MKRSEMLVILAEAIDDSYDYCTEEGSSYSYDEILSTLEKAGMLPPDAMPPALSLAERATNDAIWASTRWRWDDESLTQAEIDSAKMEPEDV